MDNSVYRALTYTVAGGLALIGLVFSTILADNGGSRQIGIAALLGFAIFWLGHEARRR